MTLKLALIASMVGLFAAGLGGCAIHLYQDHLLLDKIRTINENTLQQQYEAVMKWQEEQKARALHPDNAR